MSFCRPLGFALGSVDTEVEPLKAYRPFEALYWPEPDNVNGTSSTSKMPSLSLSCQPSIANVVGDDVWLANAAAIDVAFDMMLGCCTKPGVGLSSALRFCVS